MEAPEREPVAPLVTSYLAKITQFVEAVFERCRDHYGEPSPLLTDGIHLDTGEPIAWEGHVLSNLACQQHFLRTVDGLTALTGEAAYRNRARTWIDYALNVLREPTSGLFYWGGHSNYDLKTDRPLVGNHELKCVYPYYAFLYRVNPSVTQRFVEGFWNTHVRDWKTLLFNRHGEYRAWNGSGAWGHRYEGGPLPIIENSSLSFINTGSDLIYAAALLNHLTEDEPPLEWARRLTGRYAEVRNPRTGLGGYQFNHREPCRVRISFKPPFCERQDVNETTVITNGVIQTRYGRAAITFMNLFETLGERARFLLDFVRDDLTALANTSYEETERRFYTLLADGQRLSPSDCIEGAGYCSPRGLEPVPANGLLFLAYTKAYRLTGEDLFQRMVTSLAEGLGWSDPFSGSPETKSVSLGGDQGVYALLGWLELYQATQDTRCRDRALKLAASLVDTSFADGMFIWRHREEGTSINSPLPPALLHLIGTYRASAEPLPLPYPGGTSFDPKVILARQRRRR